jgi:hypothetical protein
MRSLAPILENILLERYSSKKNVTATAERMDDTQYPSNTGSPITSYNAHTILPPPMVDPSAFKKGSFSYSISDTDVPDINWSTTSAPNAVETSYLSPDYSRTPRGMRDPLGRATHRFRTSPTVAGIEPLGGFIAGPDTSVEMLRPVSSKAPQLRLADADTTPITVEPNRPRIRLADADTRSADFANKITDTIDNIKSTKINPVSIASNIGKFGTHLGAGAMVMSPTYSFLEPHIGSFGASIGSYAAAAPAAGAVEGLWSGATSLLGRQGIRAAASQGLGAVGAGTVAELTSVPGWMLAVMIPAMIKTNEWETEALDKSIQKQVAEREFENNNRQRAGQDPLPKIDPAKEKDSYYWLKAITPKFMPGGMGP